MGRSHISMHTVWVCPSSMCVHSPCSKWGQSSSMMALIIFGLSHISMHGVGVVFLNSRVLNLAFVVTVRAANMDYPQA